MVLVHSRTVEELKLKDKNSQEIKSLEVTWIRIQDKGLTNFRVKTLTWLNHQNHKT